eukprot:scaffold112155_cov63-Phaeocystis_antarctica.AAC.1
MTRRGVLRCCLYSPCLMPKEYSYGMCRFILPWKKARSGGSRRRRPAWLSRPRGREEDALCDEGQLLPHAPRALVVAEDPDVVGAALAIEVRPRRLQVLGQPLDGAHARGEQVAEAPVHLPHRAAHPHGDVEEVGLVRVGRAVDGAEDALVEDYVLAPQVELLQG